MDEAVRTRPWIIPLILALIGMGLYAANAGDYFRSDDFVLIANARGSIAPYFTGENLGGTTFYRPMTLVTYRLDFFLWGLLPWGFHLTNLLLFGGILALFYACVLAVFPRPALAALAVLIVAVHPAQADAVAWITGRSHLLSCSTRS